MLKEKIRKRLKGEEKKKKNEGEERTYIVLYVEKTVTSGIIFPKGEGPGMRGGKCGIFLVFPTIQTSQNYSRTLYSANHRSFFTDFIGMDFWWEFCRFSISGRAVTSQRNGPQIV